MYDAPDIVCHHNFSQCALDETLHPANVRFVHPHIFTRWGHITSSLAALKAFRLLRESSQPDWFVQLSGSDYPVKPADDVVAELAATDCDAFLDHREILFDRLPPGQNAEYGFGRPGWISMAYDRYCAFRFSWPRPSKKLLLSGVNPFQKREVFIRNPRALQWIEFNRPAHIYAGKFWFQANSKVIDRLLDDPSMRSLVRYYRGREVPEEALFHTLLCNQPDLHLCKDHKRYEDWTRVGQPPKWLDVSDVPAIIGSGAHFARKFKPNLVAQDFIDRTVLGLRP